MGSGTLECESKNKGFGISVLEYGTKKVVIKNVSQNLGFGLIVLECEYSKEGSSGRIVGFMSCNLGL